MFRAFKLTRRIFSDRSHLRTALNTQMFIREGFFESLYELEAVASRFVYMGDKTPPDVGNIGTPMSICLSLFDANLHLHSKVEELGYVTSFHEKNEEPAVKHKFQTIHALEYVAMRHISLCYSEIRHHAHGIKRQKFLDKLAGEVAQMSKLFEKHFDYSDSLLTERAGKTVPFEEIKKKILDEFRHDEPDDIESNIRLSRKILEETLILPEGDDVKEALLTNFKSRINTDIFASVIDGQPKLQDLEW